MGGVPVVVVDAVVVDVDVVVVVALPPNPAGGSHVPVEVPGMKDGALGPVEQAARHATTTVSEIERIRRSIPQGAGKGRWQIDVRR
jgi:hypothetical protein